MATSLDPVTAIEPWRSVLFRRGWWLDAVAPGRWDESTVEESGQVRGHLPYTIRHLPLGVVALGSPPLTPWLGPWVEPGNSGHDVIRQLIERLPRFDYFAQTFDPSITDWEPFHRQGFTTATRYTYRLDDLSDLDRVWRAMDGKTRNVIRRAERQVHVRTDLDGDVLLRMVRATFDRQKLRAPFSDELLDRVRAASIEHDCGRVFCAVDSTDQVHSAVMLVWDDAWTYYLVGGADPARRQSGATSLLIWEAIRFASTVSRGFDFEGSMLPSVARFFHSFGSRQIPYVVVRKANRRMSLALGARHLVRSLVARR